MSSSSYFWANLGILQKVGVWSPFYDTTRSRNACAELAYQAYRCCVISFCTLHTFTECFLICYDLNSLSMDELTVSIAYGIQHFLGIVKVYIIISQQRAIVALDNRTKQVPLYRAHDESFTKSLRDCVSTSDRIGYIYWFFVLITISCGGATGVFVTHRNRTSMERVCADKLLYYADNYGDGGGNKMPAPVPSSPWWQPGVASASAAPAPAVVVDDADERLGRSPAVNHLGTAAAAAAVLDEREAVHVRVAAIEDRLKELNLTLFQPEMVCERSKRVFPYHVWLPFDAKQTPFYQVYFVLNFLAGFSLVCCILPIDLMVMSYMRYIRFQFGVLKKDLLNLRKNCIEDVQRMRKRDAAVGFRGNNLPDEEVLTQQIIRRLEQIIHHQLAIFDFFAKTNDLFTWVLFAQYLGSAIMICGVLYTISSVVGDMLTPKFFHVAFFYSGLIFQLYSNCFYGNDVLVLSGGIAEYAYFSGWHESGAYAARLKPYIIMIMTQSLHPCKLTAGKFAGVDLPTFLAVFKASYTYYTVLVDDGQR